jgi:hypothetical protein
VSIAVTGDAPPRSHPMALVRAVICDEDGMFGHACS